MYAEIRRAESEFLHDEVQQQIYALGVLNALLWASGLVDVRPMERTKLDDVATVADAS